MELQLVMDRPARPVVFFSPLDWKGKISGYSDNLLVVQNMPSMNNPSQKSVVIEFTAKSWPV